MIRFSIFSSIRLAIDKWDQALFLNACGLKPHSWLIRILHWLKHEK